MIKWYNVKRLSKVILNKEFTFKDMDNQNKTIPIGSYYINGFWGDVCGISLKQNTLNDYLIPSRALIYFENIEDGDLK